MRGDDRIRAAVNTAKVAPGETVAVIGCGGVGMAAVNAAYIAGAARIVVVDTNPAKLQGRLHLDDWISRRIRLEQINEGFAAMKAGEVIRSIIDFEAA